MLFSLWLFWVALFGFCMSSTKTIKITQKKRSTTTYPLSHRRGILRRETFAVKSMDVNSNLLRLKLDMVYRDLPVEEAQKKFEELSQAPEEKALEPVAKPKRKTVKALVPKNK